MNEENLIETEVTEDDLSAFDGGWGDDSTAETDDMDLSEPEEDTHSEGEAPEAAEESTDNSASAEEPTADAETTEAKDTFTVKHMGEEKQVGLEEMLALASKGMDYDGLRADRDRLRDDPSAKAQKAFLDELAKRSGVESFDELETRIRAAWLQKDEKEAGRTISEADAILRVQKNKAAPAPTATETETADAAPTSKSNEAMFRSFVAEYPDVKATEIPQEVWSEVAKTGDLTGAYRRYELKSLREQVAVLRQNQENKQRSTGSRKTSGATTPKDAFDEGWDSI